MESGRITLTVLEQAPHLAEGLRALRKLRAATEVGMTRGDYARQLVEAKAVIDEAVRASTDATGKELQTALVAILQIYLDALTAWRMIDAGISLPPKEFERFKRAYHVFGVKFTKEGTLGAIWFVGKYRLEQLGQFVQ